MSVFLSVQDDEIPTGPGGDILIVDDQLENLQLLAFMLTEHGYKVRAVRSGMRALEAAKAAPPDLILLDILMPDMDGFEVCNSLKADESTRDIPVLFISALDELKDKVKAFTSGGLDYITKPFRAQEVLARVRTHLRLRALTRELAAANAELARRVAELEARNEELDAFDHTVAHDIKGPLATIVSYADLLSSDFYNLDETNRKKAAKTLQQKAHDLINIVEALLLLSNVRKIQIVPEPLEMGSLVSAAWERLASLVQEHQAELSLPSHWPVAWGYGPWIEEVWSNYLSNGCKYGGHPPRLEVGWDRPAALAGSGQIRFWVRDHGDGILPELQSSLFKPFTRLDQVRFKGHGLGLSIVRRIVEKLGGQVGLESSGVPGQGSLFYFTLPAGSEELSQP